MEFLIVILGILCINIARADQNSDLQVYINGQPLPPSGIISMAAFQQLFTIVTPNGERIPASVRYERYGLFGGQQLRMLNQPGVVHMRIAVLRGGGGFPGQGGGFPGQGGGFPGQGGIPPGFPGGPVGVSSGGPRNPSGSAGGGVSGGTGVSGGGISGSGIPTGGIPGGTSSGGGISGSGPSIASAGLIDTTTTTTPAPPPPPPTDPPATVPSEAPPTKPPTEPPTELPTTPVSQLSAVTDPPTATEASSSATSIQP